MNDCLSLKIWGNPIASNGFRRLYPEDNGSSVDEFNFKTGMGSVPYYFIVRTTKQDVEYVLEQYQGLVSSDTPPRKAFLKIAISIPKHYRLCCSKSPYDVLMNVYNMMRDRNMSLMTNTGELRYNKEMCDYSVFEALLQKYPIEWFESAFRPMAGSRVGLLVTDKIREFMKDPHYPELQEYGEVIVATAGAYPDRVPDLPIPRVPQFSLYVNGELKGESLNTNSPIVPIQWSGFDERCYDVPPPIKISMSDIINNHPCPQGVEVDWENERIDCTLPEPSPRSAVWKVKIEGVPNPQAFFNRIQVCLTTKNGKTPVNVNLSGFFSLKGEEIIAPKEALYNGSDYSISTTSENADLRQIYVKMTKKIVPPPPPPQDPTPTNNSQKIAIILPPDAISESGKDHSGKIKWYPNGWEDEKDYHCMTVKFEPKWENVDEDEGEVELWFSEVMLPHCLQANNGQLYVSVKTRKAIYNGPARIADKSKYRIDCKTDKAIDLRVEGAWRFFSFWKRCGKPIFYLFTLSLAFAIGIMLGVQAERNWLGKGGPKGDPGVEGNRDSICAAGLMEQYKCLDNDSVTFDEIEELHDSIKIKSVEVLEYLPDKEGMLKRAEAYYKVVEKLRNANACDEQFVNDLTDLLDSTKVYSNYNLATNLGYCRYLYKKENYGTNEEKLKQAQEIFLKKKGEGEINRFTDLESIKEEVERATPPTPSAPPPGNGTNNNGQPPATATQQGVGEDGPGGEH